MRSRTSIQAAITGVILLGAGLPCAAQQAGAGDKDRQIRQLQLQLQRSQTQYQTLARDLAASKKREAELNKSVNELRLRFAALGDNLLNGGQDAILEAVKNAEVLDNRYLQCRAGSSKNSWLTCVNTCAPPSPPTRMHAPGSKLQYESLT